MSRHALIKRQPQDKAANLSRPGQRQSGTNRGLWRSLAPDILSEGGAGSLLMSRPGDAAEREADEAARNVADGVPQAQRKPQAGTSTTEASSELARAVMTRVGEGAELPRSVRSLMEGSFGEDLGGVRVHTGYPAAMATRALAAEAFTVGSSIVFGQDRLDPESSHGRGLLAHELAHVVQQRSSAPGIQGRLLLTGSQPDVDALLELMGNGAGLDIDWDAATNEVSVIGLSTNPATSLLFANQLQAIIDHPTQNAELNVGRGQARVIGGQFPIPNDLTQGRVQTIDLDDMENLEANLPGHGLASVAHELQENFHAHSFPTPVFGTPRFDPSHEQGFEAESDVMQDVFGGGRLVAEAQAVAAGGIGGTTVRDFEDYYVVIETVQGTNPTDLAIDNNFRALKSTIGSFVIDGFAVGLSRMPRDAAADITAAVAAVASDPLATVLIEGFTDSTG
jgi:hypothetical protein